VKYCQKFRGGIGKLPLDQRRLAGIELRQTRCFH